MTHPPRGEEKAWASVVGPMASVDEVRVSRVKSSGASSVLTGGKFDVASSGEQALCKPVAWSDAITARAG